MSNLYSDDDDELDVRVRHLPQSVRYVQNPQVMRSYYGVPTVPSHLGPGQHTTIVARPRPDERSRDPRSPPLGPSQPVIINNRIYNDLSSGDDDSLEDDRHHRRRGGRHRRRRSRSAHRSKSSSSRSQSRSNPARIRQEEWETERMRLELEQLRINREREKDDRLVQEYRDEAELRHAKRELDDIKRRQERDEEVKRIGKEIELKRLKEEEEYAKAQKLRDKYAEEAVEKYKKQEMERQAKEKKQKEEYEKEYKQRLREDLLKSGLDEKAITAILNKEKIQAPALVAPSHEDAAQAVLRPTYTRMARKHLSIETLREYHIEYDIDPDPEYLLIKRWVPEWEQDQFWRHTKHIREKRGKMLMVEDKGHHHHHHKGSDADSVRKKHDRRRSKSPGLLMYFAGAKPA